MHRFYGVARIDGTDYRVMTLMREEENADKGNGIHSYEVQKIEVLDEQSPNTPNGVGTPNSELEAYPLANILKDVGKTMEPGKKLLDESNKADERVDFANSAEQVRHSLSPSSSAFSDPMGSVRGAVERVGKAEDRERDVKDLFDRTRQRGMDTADRILDDTAATDEQRHRRMTDVIRDVTRIGDIRKAGMKTDEERDNDKINPNALMHRFYGVARIDGNEYTVMTLMREDGQRQNNGLYAYEVANIKVFDAKPPNTLTGANTPNSELEGYPLANVIKDVGKTMEPGKKLLDESSKTDERVDFANSAEQVRHSLSPSGGALSEPMGSMCLTSSTAWLTTWPPTLTSLSSSMLARWATWTCLRFSARMLRTNLMV